MSMNENQVSEQSNQDVMSILEKWSLLDFDNISEILQDYKHADHYHMELADDIMKIKDLVTKKRNSTQ